MSCPRTCLFPKILVLFFAFHQSGFCVDWVQAETGVGNSAEGTVGYTYVPGNRREPFRSMLVESEHKPISQGTKSDSLDAMGKMWNLLGVMSGLKGKQAMLQNAKGQKFVVSIGDMLSGKQFRVIQLTDTTVTLEYRAGNPSSHSSEKLQLVDLTFVR